MQQQQQQSPMNREKELFGLMHHESFHKKNSFIERQGNFSAVI